MKKDKKKIALAKDCFNGIKKVYLFNLYKTIASNSYLSLIHIAKYIGNAHVSALI